METGSGGTRNASKLRPCSNHENYQTKVPFGTQDRKNTGTEKIQELR